MNRGALPAGRREPLTARLSAEHPLYDVIRARHTEAVRRGEATYRDPGTGLEVLTAQELWERGTCCTSGCRHCPFTAGPRGAQPRPGTW